MKSKKPLLCPVCGQVFRVHDWTTTAMVLGDNGHAEKRMIHLGCVERIIKRLKRNGLEAQEAGRIIRSMKAEWTGDDSSERLCSGCGSWKSRGSTRLPDMNGDDQLVELGQCVNSTKGKYREGLVTGNTIAPSSCFSLRRPTLPELMQKAREQFDEWDAEMEEIAEERGLEHRSKRVDHEDHEIDPRQRSEDD